MEVCVSGPVWSTLLFELANSKGDSEGFLIGRVSGRAVSSISDTSSQQLKYEKVSTIQGFIPSNNTFSFYDNVGCIDIEKLQNKILETKELKKVIGWYKFRRNTQPIVSMRERQVHFNLVEKLEFQPCKASIEAGCSVHSLNYTIYSSSSKKSLFDSHELKLINLGDTSHSDYKQQPDTIRTDSEIFQQVTDSYRNDFFQGGYMQQPLSTHSMYISLVKKMEHVLNEVKDSESTVAAMQEEVDLLRTKVDDLRNKEHERQRKLEENQVNVQTAQLIDINYNKPTTSRNERVVQGAESISKRSRHSSCQSRNRQMEPMETDILIDFNDDSSDTASNDTINKNTEPLNGALVYQNNAQKDSNASTKIDEDETQDNSLSQGASVMESLSPSY